MNREQYIQTKTANPLKIVYDYYKENFDNSKHSPFLTESEFFPYLQMTMDVNGVAQKIMHEYDAFYGVVTLYDRNGNIITYF
jgi:hypothetical protein